MKDPKVHGDAYVVVQIEVPKHLSEEERRAVENLRAVQEKHAHGGAA